MIRSVLAVFAGFLAIVVLVLASAPVIAKLLLPATAARPTRSYLVANLLTGFAFAGVGGWIAAHLAGSGPHWHAVALATLVLALGITTAAQGGAARAGQPVWYGWLLPFVGAAGALLGGWL
jgi:hypothetical protein